MIKRVCLAGLSLAVVALLALAGCAEKPHGPNVILISIDSLRADHLGCYGYSRDTTPAIDEIAREGVMFEDAFSTTSWTLPAHVSMLTSLVPTTHGVVKHFLTLDDNVETLAQMLERNGYTTGGFISTVYLHSIYGLNRGFQVYEDLSATPLVDEEMAKSPESGIIYGLAIAHDDITSPAITKRVLEWLDTSAKEPFFLFVHYWDVHYDYIPPPPYDTMFNPGYKGDITATNYYYNEAINPNMPKEDLEQVISLYDGEIRFVDEHIGRLMQALKQSGMDRNTLLVLTADHGEEFFEHGSKGHQQDLYDEEIHIPLIFRWPDHIPEGKRIKTPASVIDIMPSILDLAGVPPGTGMMGASLRPHLLEGREEPGRSVLSELCWFDEPAYHYSLRSDRAKIIYIFGDEKEFLYDLQKDPGEKTNLARSDNISPLQAELEASLMEAIKSAKAKKAELNIRDKHLQGMTKAQEERLRSLGYIK